MTTPLQEEFQVCTSSVAIKELVSNFSRQVALVMVAK